jgi:anaerobilin synthase
VRLLDHAAFKFDSYVPLYNWIYPIAACRSGQYVGAARWEVFKQIRERDIASRALYFHIPFCETICSFCPFVRGTYSSEDDIEFYVRALIIEIRRKSDFLCTRTIPVGAIFFGGGTPSLLSPDQIRRIGAEIHSAFDLSKLREFSFEFEVKSITEEKLSALKEIGVSHARFGLQTFHPRYRQLFRLTATMDNIFAAAAVLPRYFPHVSCDIMYGMHGQTEEDLFFDLERVVALGLTNIDYYPINNLVTQRRLHRDFDGANLLPTSGLTKHYMNCAVRAFLRDNNYLPHNGHGYTLCPSEEVRADPVVTRTYSFVYHEHVYGYSDHDVIGFGVNAISSTRGFTLYNEVSRSRYVQSIMDSSEWEFTVCEHSDDVDAARAVALRLPYHGFANSDSISWKILPETTRSRLDQLIEAGLVQSDREGLFLTREGWHWYVNLMYYLLPPSEQQALGQFVAQASRRRTVEEIGIPPILLGESNAPLPGRVL